MGYSASALLFLYPVIIYLADKAQFLRDNDHGEIDEIIDERFRDVTGRRVGRAELRSWQSSLGQMAGVLRDRAIPADTGVAVEYHIPQSSKRIDVTLTGRGPRGEKNAIVIELKQWDKASSTSKDAIVVTKGGRGLHELVHPSYQAWSYAALMEGFNSAVYDGHIALQPCAYLHNYRSDGEIEFVGRRDFQVKIRGHRIEPGEVEAALLKHPRVRQAVVVDREFAAGDRRLIAYVVTEEHISTSELSDYVKDILPSYMAPAMWVTLDQLPLTANGKVDRAALVTPQLSTKPRLRGEYVAPRNVIEQQLVQIWEDLFKVQPISITHDFFELGGHSVLTIMLTTRIQERLGKRVSVADVFRAPTIEALARLISGILSEDSHHTSLVPLRMQGTHAPLFVPHGAGGHVLCYNELAQHLGDTQPFFGLQTPQLEAGQIPASEIETMAAAYIEAIRNVQPVGPYWLAGWSMGGVIAFEIAQQLQQQQQEIALLALIDSRVPSEELSQPSAGEVLYWFARELGFSDDNLRIPTAETPVVYRKIERGLWKEAKTRGLVPAEMSLLEFMNVLNTFKVNFNAVRRYQPRQYDGRIVLLTAERDQTDKVTAWANLATRGIEHHVVPGDHFSMLKDPHVEILATRLCACLP